MTLLAAGKLALEYRDALGLSDWTVTVHWLKPEHTQNQCGMLLWTSERHIAWIYIRKGDTQHEETIIHELLHLRLEGHRPKVKRYDCQYEWSLDQIAAALWKR